MSVIRRIAVLAATCLFLVSGLGVGISLADDPPAGEREADRPLPRALLSFPASTVIERGVEAPQRRSPGRIRAVAPRQSDMSARIP